MTDDRELYDGEITIRRIGGGGGIIKRPPTSGIPAISGPLIGVDPLSDILGRRRPVGLVRESYPMRGGTL
jgi:hypothetical protein